MNIKQLLVRSLFAFIVLLMPVVALEPLDDSVFGFTDFFSYYTQAKLIIEQPCQDIYDPDKLIRRARELYPPLNSHGPYYVGEPPLSLTLLLPAGFLPKDFALIVCKGILVILTGISMALLAVIFEQTERQFIWSTVAVAASGPFWEATRVTKPGLVVLFGLTLCLWYLRNNKQLKGALCMLPWTFRPQLLLMFFAGLFGARQLRFLAWVAVTSVCLFVLTLPLFGLDNYKSWQKYLSYMSWHHDITAPFLHPTIRGQLMRFTEVPANVVSLVWPFTFGASLLLAVYLGDRFKRSARWLQLCTACMPLGVVAGPYCHNYDLVLLIPSVVAFFKLPVMAALTKRFRITCFSLVGLSLLCFEMPIYSLIHYTYLQRNIWIISPLFISLLLLSVIFVYVAWRDAAEMAKASS
jgi:hypothetical protein